ncbi:hypothetical protein D9756_010516 [Leucocoprinus leucothites]|uniref:Uncharacterized protein n=1 Tax=Leucocoprinus leucothites TaxID=201217 RepID=A0A8H5CUH4_9AGAR|nr:hypothetical protein D9756_010516 [Leucoagaricus leucothites]
MAALRDDSRVAGPVKAISLFANNRGVLHSVFTSSPWSVRNSGTFAFRPHCGEANDTDHPTSASLTPNPSLIAAQSKRLRRSGIYSTSSRLVSLRAHLPITHFA